MSTGASAEPRVKPSAGAVCWRPPEPSRSASPRRIRATTAAAAAAGAGGRGPRRGGGGEPATWGAPALRTRAAPLAGARSPEAGRDSPQSFPLRADSFDRSQIAYRLDVGGVDRQMTPILLTEAKEGGAQGGPPG